MKPVDVKSNTYIDFNEKNNQEGAKIKFGDNVTIFKYKKIFCNMLRSKLV